MFSVFQMHHVSILANSNCTIYINLPVDLSCFDAILLAYNKKFY
jgi:hypothetical protein